METDSCTGPFNQPLGSFVEAQVIIPAVGIVPQFKDRYTRELVLGQPFIVYRQVRSEFLVDDSSGKNDGRLCGTRSAER
jgi:hypothetical protein